MNLSEKIALLRRQKGLSQEQLAEILDVSRQAVYKWETNASTPDLDKIKKIASYFGVSFDLLLNDQKDISTEYQPSAGPQPTAPASLPPSNPPPPKLRPVFRSTRKLPSDYADICHGYSDSDRRSFEGSEEYYGRLSYQMNRLVQISSYETIPLQNDILACFFVDNAAKVCGLIFYGCEQFVCPFENIVDLTVSTNGQKLDFSGSSTVVGASPASFMVGRMPQANIMNPSIFDVNIAYLNDNQVPMNYSFTLYSGGRTYITYNSIGNSLDKLAFHSNLMSDATMKQLTEIQAKIKAIMVVGSMIRSGSIPVPPMNSDKYKRRQEETAAANKENNNRLDELKQQSASKKNLRIKLALAAIAVMILIIIIVNCSR